MTGFPIKSSMNLLQWLVVALLKEDKSQTGQVRISLQVYQNLLRGEGQSWEKGWLSLSYQTPGHFPSLPNFCGSCFCSVLPLHSRTSLSLPLGWLQKKKKKNSHLAFKANFMHPLLLRDFSDSIGSKARRNHAHICLLRCLQCTGQSTFPPLLTLLVNEFPEGSDHLTHLWTSVPDQMAWQTAAQ